MRKEKREREVEKGLKSWCQLVPAMITVCLGMDEINYKLKKYKEGNKNKRKLDTRRTLEIFPTDTRRQQIVAIVVVVVLL